MRIIAASLCVILLTSFSSKDKAIKIYEADIIEGCIVMYQTDGKVMEVFGWRNSPGKMTVDFDNKSIVMTFDDGTIQRIYLTKQTRVLDVKDGYKFTYDALMTTSFDNYAKATDEQVRLTVKKEPGPQESIIKMDTPFLTTLYRASKTTTKLEK